MSSAGVTLLLDRRGVEELGTREARSLIPRPLTQNPAQPRVLCSSQPCADIRMHCLFWTGPLAGLGRSGGQVRNSDCLARQPGAYPLHLPLELLLAP